MTNDTSSRKSSRLPGFYKLPLEERLRALADFAGWTPEDVRKFTQPPGEDFLNMIECSVGWYGVPLTLCPNVLVKHTGGATIEYLVPYATEEASNISGISKAGTLIRQGGLCTSHYTQSIMIGQIEMDDVPDAYQARERVLQHKDLLLRLMNEQEADSKVNQNGGGALDINATPHYTPYGSMLIVDATFDVKNIIGGGYITRVMTGLAPKIQELVGGDRNIRILSNDGSQRLAYTEMRLPIEGLKRDKEDEEKRTGLQVAQRIVRASYFAKIDPKRAVTHNKGIFNGIDALCTVTGNDSRAQETAANQYAVRTGRYMPLSEWRIDDNTLVGRLVMPIVVGTYGGVTHSHRQSAMVFQLLGNPGGQKFAELVAAMGLYQNFAALYTLTTMGITEAHGKLNLWNLICSYDGTPDEIPKKYRDEVIAELRETQHASAHAALEIYRTLRDLEKKEL